MAVTTKKTFPATTNSTTDTFGPIGIELNNQDDLDVYITESGGTRVLQYKQTSASTTDSNHPQVNDTTGLYFPPVAAGVALKNYTISADNNNVIFNSALPSGAVVSVERRTRDSSSSYTSFSGGSTIRSTDLNTAFDETRFTAQEGRNKAFDLERQTFSEDGNIRLLEDQSLIYEGATDDAHETKLAITDPTADRTITFPDVSGNVVTTGDTGTVDATMLATNSVNSDELVADSVITAKIANDQVTYAKIQNVSATDRILGRDSSGAGDIEEITPAALRTMLNIEDGSTGDQSNAEIRAAVEAASDSNVFTDADHTKLNSVETGATADQSNAEIRAAVEAASDSNVFTDADHTKLNGIEASATADQTGAEIKAAYEGESNTNAFTDAEKSKVADAVLNADLDGKGEILVGDGSGDPTILAVGTNNHVLVADSNEPSGVKWATVPAGSGLSNVVEDTTPQLGGDLDVNGNDIVSTSNANINIIPNGTGDVNLDADTIRVGDNNTDTTITTQGTGDLTLSTNSGTNSGTIEIEDGANNDIVITPNGTGDVIIDGLKYPQADGSANQFLKTNGSAQLSWADVDLSAKFSKSGDSITGDSTIVSGVTNKNIHIDINNADTLIRFDDDLKATFGDSDDLQVYWNGTQGHIVAPSGRVDITADEFQLVSHDSGGRAIYLNDSGGHLELGFDGGHDAYFNGGSITLFSDTTLNAQKDLRFADADSSNYVAFQAPATIGSNVTWTLPAADGSANQVLKTAGDGTLSWTTVSGTITALNNQTANRLTTIGSTTTELDGEANLTFDGSTLAVTGNQTVSTTLAATGQITGRGFECPATVTANWSIGAANNAFFPGPMTVDSGVTVTVPANRTLTIV